MQNELAVLDVLRHVQKRCPHSRDLGKGYCNAPVLATVVHHKNLMCDRMVVGTCTEGHTQLIAVIE